MDVLRRTDKYKTEGSRVVFKNGLKKGIGIDFVRNGKEIKI